MQPESAYVNIDRRQRADRLHIFRSEADLLMRFAQGGLLECFARIDRAARQRHLAAVQLLERAGANGQNEMGMWVRAERGAAGPPPGECAQG